MLDASRRSELERKKIKTLSKQKIIKKSFAPRSK